jgi:hypothetical protein
MVYLERTGHIMWAVTLLTSLNYVPFLSFFFFRIGRSSWLIRTAKDPQSIFGIASGLASVTLRLSKSIFTCVEEVKSVDITLNIFYSELLSLSHTSGLVSRSFGDSRPGVLFDETRTGQNLHVGLFSELEVLLKDCKSTFESLDGILQNISTGGRFGKGIFRKPVASLKLNLKSSDLVLIVPLMT